MESRIEQAVKRLMKVLKISRLHVFDQKTLLLALPDVMLVIEAELVGVSGAVKRQVCCEIIKNLIRIGVGGETGEAMQRLADALLPAAIDAIVHCAKRSNFKAKARNAFFPCC